MTEYIGLAVAFISALAAITGKTWNPNESGLRKITAAGWVIAVCALVGTIGSALSIYSTREEKIEQKQRIIRITNQNAELMEEISSLQDHNTILSRQISELEERNSALLREVENVRQGQDTQPIVTMTEGVRLEPGQTWNAPVQISTGAVVRLVGFQCRLVIQTGNDIRHVNAEGTEEVPVIGPAGEKMRLSIERPHVHGLHNEPEYMRLPLGIRVRNPTFSERVCSGKVQVWETPRSRTIHPSYVPQPEQNGG